MHELVTYVLGGGLVSLIVGVATINSRIKRSIAETEDLNLKNSQSATHILMENIVEPLKQELHETREEFEATKQEMALLREAITATRNCSRFPNCPVVVRLQQCKDFAAGDDGAAAFCGSAGGVGRNPAAS